LSGGSSEQGVKAVVVPEGAHLILRRRCWLRSVFHSLRPALLRAD